MKRLRLNDRFVVSVLLLLLTLVFSATGALSRIDNVLFDLGQRMALRQVPTDVVVVAVDEQSLAALGRWPWSRRVHAQLIDRLHTAGARVIGLDMILSEPQREDPGADLALADALARAGNVVMPVVIEQVRRNGQTIETLPLPELSEHVAALGHVHALLDGDAIARSIAVWEGVGQAAWPHFAQAVLSVARQPFEALSPTDIHTLQTTSIVRNAQRYINFSTAHQQLHSVSFVQVLQGHVASDAFRDKLVLVGVTASGMADSLPTPVSGFQQPMPGVEFLANAVISMRDHTLITRIPSELGVLLVCVLALLPTAWLSQMRPRTGLWLTGVYITVLLGVAIALPVAAHLWLPLSASVLGAFLAYPLWAWRKLELSNRFLDAELVRLKKILGTQFEVEEKVKPASLDRIQHRINQVQAAAIQVQQLDQTRRDNLAFLSHDIRLPLASAAAQMEHVLGDHHPAYKQVLRALAATQNFLQTSRAEMLKPHELTELDVIDLLHQVADDLYPLTQERGVHLALNVPDEPVWVMGHFDTLSRAVSNLLHNALKFSPEGGVVALSAYLTQALPSHMNIVVSDQGTGVLDTDIETIFKQFGRSPQTHAAGASVLQGVGLGLYFVHVTAQQHSGSVSVQRENGLTHFALQLPLHAAHSDSPPASNAMV